MTIFFRRTHHLKRFVNRASGLFHLSKLYRNVGNPTGPRSETKVTDPNQLSRTCESKARVGMRYDFNLPGALPGSVLQSEVCETEVASCMGARCQRM